MAMRQYIGARYCPKFVGTYDATQIYEALDVVDNGSGTSYIAKKPTPAGTPLTNTEYWFLYGAMSGAILNLQNQIDENIEKDFNRYYGLVFRETSINKNEDGSLNNIVEVSDASTAHNVF